MEQVITLRRRAKLVRGLEKRALGRVVHAAAPPAERRNCFLVVAAGTPLLTDFTGYGAVLIEDGIEIGDTASSGSPLLTGYESLSGLADGSIIAIEPTGGTNTLYRPESDHNAIFATGRCNSNCLMCSQPPVDWEPDDLVEEHLRMIELIQAVPSNLGLSGGEPTLLGEGLVTILKALKHKFPQVPLSMLTNGRRLADADYVRELVAAAPANFICGIPLHADVAAIHDYIAQAKGAFEETISGLYNCARYKLPVEIRVVLHKQSIQRLPQLMEFIYRNLPFAGHIALMGMENMGYVKKNWETLWVDPADYQEDIEDAVKYLHYRGMHASLYNHPRCTIPRSLWTFARQSISDFKNLFLNECATCTERPNCSGIFSSAETRHSRGIQPIH